MSAFDSQKANQAHHSPLLLMKEHFRVAQSYADAAIEITSREDVEKVTPPPAHNGLYQTVERASHETK